jgi:hypothetical protein
MYDKSSMYLVNPPLKRPPSTAPHHHAFERLDSSAIGLVSLSRASYAQELCV